MVCPMEVNRMDLKEYGQVYTHPFLAFDTVPFCELNRSKCDGLHALSFSDGKKNRLGFVMGERDGKLRAPFSAPYTMFAYNKSEKLEYYDEAAEALKEYARKQGKSMILTLPPTVFGSEVSKALSAFYRVGAENLYVNLNYHYETEDFVRYEENLERNARKNFHHAMQQNLCFLRLDSTNANDIERVYRVIKQNREERGFPLRMSLDSIVQTAQVIEADFFVLTYEDHDVAAAQVFYVAPHIARVIYWGDIPAFSYLRVMNYLTYKIFEFYYSSRPEIRLLDIGISTEDGVPNYGLCDFKSSIGCKTSLQFTLKI